MGLEAPSESAALKRLHPEMVSTVGEGTAAFAELFKAAGDTS